MKSEHLAIIKQLIKEFWIQFILSIVWSTYNVYSATNDENSLSIFIKNFGTSFFLLSWFFGQFIRVKKQKKTESSFEELKLKTENLIAQLEDASNKTIGNLTGGDGFPIVKVASSPAIIGIEEECCPVIFIAVEGDYPAFDVEILLFYYSLSESSLSSELKKIEILHKRTFSRLEKVPSFKSPDNLKIVAHITTRNGAFIQKLRMDIIDQRLVWASKTSKFDEKGDLICIHDEIQTKYKEMKVEEIFGTGLVDFRNSKNLKSSAFLNANDMH